MVEIVSVGILGVQGDVSEHITSMKNAFGEKGIQGKVIVIKHRKEIKDIDALIIPGGESKTISEIICKSGIYDAIIQKIKQDNLAIMGTCAGCILLAKEIMDDNQDVKSLQLMDIKVERNAFGRQKESFETDIKFDGFSKTYHAVFIRAPIITEVQGNCKILSKIGKKIIAARQDSFLALSFHPELTTDLRIHTYFLDMI